MATGTYIFSLNCNAVIDESSNGIKIHEISILPSAPVAIGKLTGLSDPYYGREDLEVIEWEPTTRNMSVLILTGGNKYNEKYRFFFDSYDDLRGAMIKIGSFDPLKRYSIKDTNRCIVDDLNGSSYNFDVNSENDTAYHLLSFDLLMTRNLNPTTSINLADLWGGNKDTVITTRPYIPEK